MSSPLLLLVLLFTLAFTLVGVQGMLAQYARGVVRGAADEGARAGAPEFAGTNDCARAAGEALSQLLGGALGSDIRIECSADDERSIARATGTIPSIAPGLIPATTIDVTAVVVKEPEYES
jgi:hypothetical protein